MPNIKIVLKRSPADPENGVWINGEKLEGVLKVEVQGSTSAAPYVTIKMVPNYIELETENPDMVKVTR